MEGAKQRMPELNRVVNMHEAKTQLSRLVERAEGGEEVVIARRGKPVAKIVPIGAAFPVNGLGSLRGEIELAPANSDEHAAFEAGFEEGHPDDPLRVRPEQWRWQQ
ncbi:hypothetical protein BH10ACT11_BH10ACT11_13700 [soil metagenome]